MDTNENLALPYEMTGKLTLIFISKACSRCYRVRLTVRWWRASSRVTIAGINLSASLPMCC
jgi:hypothetical protein